ncbi:MAG: hypothetical protein L0H23_11695 [Luteimonas sp.]|nr:hypothetical protein [Luteimonas sp.]
MPADARPRPLPWLHLLALVLLSLWLLAKPVMAASCELDDMGLAQGSSQCVVAAVSGSRDACCPGEVCGDCCTAANVVPAAPARALPLPAGMGPHAFRPATTDSVPLLMAIRPPITA